MNLFNLFAKISLDDGEFVSGVNQAETKMGKAKTAAKAMGDGIKSAMTAAANAAKVLVTGLGAVLGAMTANTEMTREYREDINRLTTAFESVGKSADDGAAAFRSMFGLLGESDQAVEAASHLAELTNNTQELVAWENIAAGVSAKFGDSLPLESLTEAANETAKVGTVTGSFADALNWAGISEEAFNEQLAAYNTTAERATFITETLSGAYDETGQAYRDLNADVIAAREAQLSLNDALARAGGLFEPILTAGKTALAGGLTAMIDGFEENGVQGLIAAVTKMVASAFSSIQTHARKLLSFGGDMAEQISKGLTTAIPQIVSRVGEIMTQLQGQQATILPQLITWGGDLVTGMVQGITEALPQIAETATTLIEGWMENATNLAPRVAEVGANIINTLATSLSTLIPTVVSFATDVVPSMVTSIVDALPSVLDAGVSLIQNLLDGIVSLVPTVVEQIPLLVTSLVDMLAENLPRILGMGVSLILELLTGVLNTVPSVIAEIPKLVTSLAASLVQNLPTILGMGVSILAEMISGIVSALPSIGLAVLDIVAAIGAGFTGAIDSIKQFGADIIDYIWQGVQDMADWLGDQISGFFSGIWDGVKDFFGGGVETQATAAYGGGASMAGVVQSVGAGAVTSTANFTQNIYSSRSLSAVEHAQAAASAMTRVNWGLA